MTDKKIAAKAVSLALLLGLISPLAGCEVGGDSEEGGEGGEG
jgi:hypothetical protein